MGRAEDTESSSSSSSGASSASSRRGRRHRNRNRNKRHQTPALSESDSESENDRERTDGRNKSVKEKNVSSDVEGASRSRRIGSDADRKRPNRMASGSRSDSHRPQKSPPRRDHREDGKGKFNAHREERHDSYRDKKKWRDDERYGGPSQRYDGGYEGHQRSYKNQDNDSHYNRDRQYYKRNDRRNESNYYRKEEGGEGYSTNNSKDRPKYSPPQRPKREHSPPQERHRPDKRQRTDFQRDQKRPNRREEGGSDQQNYDWGKKTDDTSGKPVPKTEKEKPNFALSGKLTEDQNTMNGVVIKYAEPPEARKPKRRWRFYPFKGETALPILYLHRQSGFLIGRDRKVADLPLDHPSISKQHAALQYRLVPFKRENGSTGKRIRPYIIDLESANGTFVNNNKIEPRKYVELLERDVIKFGFSAREYVLLHENSKDDETDDDDDVNASESLISLVKDEPVL